MDPRIETIRCCAEFLAAPHGGDREARSLVEAVRACLELCARILADRGEPAAKGYRDAIDKMVACGAIDLSLAGRLAGVFDVAERLPAAWSTVKHEEFEWARAAAVQALTEFAEGAERHLSQGQPAHL